MEGQEGHDEVEGGEGKLTVAERWRGKYRLIGEHLGYFVSEKPIGNWEADFPPEELLLLTMLIVATILTIIHTAKPTLLLLLLLLPLLSAT